MSTSSEGVTAQPSTGRGDEVSLRHQPAPAAANAVAPVPIVDNGPAHDGPAIDNLTTLAGGEEGDDSAHLPEPALPTEPTEPTEPAPHPLPHPHPTEPADATTFAFGEEGDDPSHPGADAPTSLLLGEEGDDPSTPDGHFPFPRPGDDTDPTTFAFGEEGDDPWQHNPDTPIPTEPDGGNGGIVTTDAIGEGDDPWHQGEPPVIGHGPADGGPLTPPVIGHGPADGGPLTTHNDDDPGYGQGHDPVHSPADPAPWGTPYGEDEPTLDGIELPSQAELHAYAAAHPTTYDAPDTEANHYGSGAEATHDGGSEHAHDAGHDHPPADWSDVSL